MLRQEGRLFSHLVTPAVCLMGNPRGEPASLSRRFAVGIAVPNVKSSVPYLDTHFCEKMCPLSTQIWTGQSIGIQLSNKLGLANIRDSSSVQLARQAYIIDKGLSLIHI